MAPARHARRGPGSDQACSDPPNASPRRLGRPAASARLPKPTPSPQLVVGGAIPGARVSTRARPAAGCPPAALTGAHIRRGRGQPDVKCSPGRRDAPRRSRRRRQSAVSPIRRGGAGACSVGAAKRPIRPRCAASPRVLREIPRSGVTCRCRAPHDLDELTLASERARPTAR